MSLYNMFNGYEASLPVVMAALGVRPRQLPRFQDAYVTYRDPTHEEAVLVVMTRTGGPNAEHYQAEHTAMRKLVGYLDENDDEFDCTFRLFRYTVADQETQDILLEFLAEEGTPLTLRQKAEQARGPDETLRQRAAKEVLAAQLRPVIEGLLGDPDATGSKSGGDGEQRS